LDKKQKRWSWSKNTASKGINPLEAHLI